MKVSAALLTLIATGVLALAACSAPTAGATVDPATGPSSALPGDPSPAPGSELPPGNGNPYTREKCFGIDETIELPPQTVENVMRVADLVIVAEVVDIEPGVWNTADGQPPTGRPGPEYSPSIVTPVNVLVAETLAGQAGAEVVRVLVRGGEAEGGCVVQRTHPSPNIEKGKPSAFFLRGSTDAEGKQLEAQQVLAAWEVNVERQVKTPLDGVLSTNQLAALLESVSGPG